MEQSTQPRLKGFATPEGTRRFRERAVAEKGLPPEHFRTTAQGLTLTSLGMGTYLGNPDPDTDADMTQAAVDSVETGAINVLDTAINYRYQFSERSLGEALRRLTEKGISREEIFLCSKNGFVTPDAAVKEPFPAYFQKNFFETGIVSPDDIVEGMHCMTPAYLDDQLNRSLANLGVETLDLMYLHNAAESQLAAVGREAFKERLRDAFEFYEKARSENRIRFYGMATWNCFMAPPDRENQFLSLEAVVRLAESMGGSGHGFRFIQLPFNLGMMDALSLENQMVGPHRMSLLQAAEELGIGVFTSVPLLQGQLLAQPSLPRFPGLSSPAQTCLQFVRSTPGILAPLAGHKQKRHVEDNLGVAKVPPLTLAEFQELFAPANP